MSVPTSSSSGPATPTTSVIDFSAAYPNSTKIYVEDADVRVPMREIALSGGEPSLRVYDTSGPQGIDVKDGLPKLRAEWIRARGVEQTGSGALRAKARRAQRPAEKAA